MIEIITLFLGLFHGAQTVELEVAAPVVEVELRLDGETVATLTEPPWSTRVDLGPVLAPHELIAVARDAHGDELGRARRWINREVEVPADDNVTAIVLSLDPGVRLPPVAEMQDWFSAGGEPVDILRVERGTAEVVIVRDPLVQPYLDRTASWFFQLRLECHLGWDDISLTDKQAFVAASRKQLIEHGNPEIAWQTGAVWEQWHDAFSFGDDAGARFVSPRAAPVSRVARRHGIFNLTTERPSNEYGLLWHSALVQPLLFPSRLSDAVAMAGLEAHAGRGRRAVVLLMEDEAMGPSRYPPAVVRDYLEALQVPLYVWDFGLVDPGGRHRDTPAAESPAAESPAEGAGTVDSWGDVRDLTHRSTLNSIEIADWLGRVAKAANEVRKQLRRQRVVWLRGAHAPHRVELTERAVGLRLAGSRRADAIEGEG